MITAIILAAGESSRMASPKALLRIGNDTFAASIARKAKECGIEVVYLIAGPHHQIIKNELPKELDITVIFNLHYREGQVSSLKEGLRNLPTGSTEALVWPVDQPLVQTETVRKLMDAFRKERQHLTIPVFQGKRGHPLIYDLSAIHAILSFRPEKTAKELQVIFENQTALVEVDDPGILIDIDTPQDYEKWITNSGPSGAM